MKQNLDERITYYERLTYAIARTIRDKGYQIADSTGLRVNEPPGQLLGMGILEPREPIEEKSFLGFKRSRKQRALHIGTLWVDNKELGAKPDKNWVLEVYGRDNVSKLTELVKELSEPKKVSVQVRLDSEQPRFETYWGEFDTL